jgi:dihydroorotase
MWTSPDGIVSRRYVKSFGVFEQLEIKSNSERWRVMKYDLVLKNGHVIDPAQNINGRRDIGIKDGKIAAIAEKIPEADAKEAIDVKDKFVTPGLIDIHAHVYAGVTTWGVKPDPPCLGTGVTTVVDAGSSGWAGLPGFRWYISQPAKTRVLCFVHISGIGLTYGPVGEMTDLAYAHPKKTAELVMENRDITVGVKVRQGGFQVGDNGTKPLSLAVEAAEIAKVPVMVHIGAGVPLPSVLSLLRPGDIVTHCFQGRGDTILDENNKVIPEVWQARERGIIMDVGHGAGSLHFEVAQKALEQGFFPDVISSDLHTGNLYGPVYDLITTVSKFLNLGVSLEELVEKSTIAPAKAIRREDQLGTLRVGSESDIAVFELQEGKFEFYDTHGNLMVGKKKLAPHLSIRGGKVWRRSDFVWETEEEVRKRYSY